MLGIGLALLAAIFFGLTGVIVRLAVQQTNPLIGTLVSMVSSTLLVWALVFTVNLADLQDVSLKTVFWFGAVGILNFPLARFLSFISIEQIGASRSTSVVAMAPLFATLAAVLFTGEEINLLIALGMALILTGVYITIREGFRT